MSLPVDPSRYLAYLGVMTAMAFFPGPANLFAAAVGMARGRRAALAGVVGMNLATLVWYAGSALGLGALVAAAPAAFRLLRLAGAAYLVWMAYRAVAEPQGGHRPVGRLPAAGRSALVEGFLVQIANPKMLLFFTAVLPAFLDLSRPITPQLVLFAPATIAMDALAMSAFGLGGAVFAGRMEEARFRRMFALATATLLIVAAGLVAVSAFQP